MTPSSWSDVRRGAVLTVRYPGRARPFRYRVARVKPEPLAGPGEWALVHGTRLCMSGVVSRQVRPELLIKLEYVEEATS